MSRAGIPEVRDGQRRMPRLCPSVFAGVCPKSSANESGALCFDAPCGDFYFMSRVHFPAGWSYIGGDISPAALRDARRFAPNREFREFDLLTDPFRQARPGCAERACSIFPSPTFAPFWKI